MINKSVVVIFMSIFTVLNSHALDIEGYCSDMRQANTFSHDWYLRCVNTLNVQKKYEKIETDKEKRRAELATEFEILKRRTDLYFELAAIRKGIDETNPDVDKVLLIMSKMKNECELTPASKRADDENCQIESYKEYEDMLKVAENKK